MSEERTVLEGFKMGEMVERVAKAIVDFMVKENGETTKWEDAPDEARAEMCRMARDAIEAMREPTDAMLERAKHTDIKGPVKQADKMIYQAMIDEALK